MDKGFEFVISIHALREEGDDLSDYLTQDQIRFQSTPSARRATHPVLRDPEHGAISIHALREEGDSSGLCSLWGARYFNPRPPRGGRLAVLALLCAGSDISIHALREEGDERRAPH